MFLKRGGRTKSWTPKGLQQELNEYVFTRQNRCCFELGEGIKSVSEDIGYTRASIYNWWKKYLKGGTVALMNGKNIKPSTLIEGTAGSAPEHETNLKTKDVEEMTTLNIKLSQVLNQFVILYPERLTPYV